MKRDKCIVKIMALSTLVLFSFVLFMATPALAHKVSVFAWIEGETVHTQSKFMGGKAVRKARIVVSRTDGHLLLEGETDEEGMFSFPLPERAPMTIVVEAGMGHRGQWTITSEEIADAFPGENIRQGATKSIDNMEGTKTEERTSVEAIPGSVTTKQIQAAVEKALDEKLSPIVNRLNRHLEERRAGITDILGGIGYIFGLAGVAAFVHSRRKEKEKR